MKSWTEILATLAVGVGSLIILIILGPLLGALGGLVVGIFFSTPILNTLSAFGVEGVAMWELGATLAFFAGFFKAVNTKGDGK